MIKARAARNLLSSVRLYFGTALPPHAFHVTIRRLDPSAAEDMAASYYTREGDAGWMSYMQCLC